MPDNDVNSYTAADFDFSYPIFGENMSDVGRYTAHHEYEPAVSYTGNLSLIFSKALDAYSVVLHLGDTVSLKKQRDGGKIVPGYIVRIKKLLTDRVYVVAVRIQEYPGVVFFLLPEALKEYPEKKGKLFNCYDRISLDKILSERYDHEIRQVRIGNKNQFENMRKVQCWYTREKNVFGKEGTYCDCAP